MTDPTFTTRAAFDLWLACARDCVEAFDLFGLYQKSRDWSETIKRVTLAHIHLGDD